MDNLLTGLNKEQKEAVTHGEGPLLIVAGAGTGKTTVITKRVAWLILTQDIKPDEVLALTFTDKAAGEMEERIDKLLPYGYVDLWISTFHSFCDRILKQHAIDIGLPADYKLLNQTEQWLLVRKNLEKFDLDYYRPLGNPTRFIHALLKHFSRAKDEMVDPSEYLEYVKGLRLNTDTPPKDSLNHSYFSSFAQAEEIKRLEEVANAYHVYQNLLLENNALDFGDLINYTLKLFKTRPHILEKYRQQFKYILIDEFQDTNYAQYELIKLLAAPKNNLTVVADDDQAIYRFRGASMSNIIQFKNDFPEAKEIFITVNFRSFQNILDLSYKFITQNNPNRLEWQLQLANDESKAQTTSQKSRKANKKLSKKLKASRQGEGIIEHLHAPTVIEEARLVLKKIFELQEKNKDASLNDYAVLVRANDYAEPFIKTFAAAGIPYQFVASRGLYSKPIVLDILAYLKLLDNYHESPAMWRVLNFLHWQIPDKDLTNLSYWAQRKNWSLYETMQQARPLNNFSEEALLKFDKILSLIEKHTRLAREAPISRVVFAFLDESGYLKSLIEKESQAQESLNYLNQFYRKIQSFEVANSEPTVKNFLEMIDFEIQAGEAGALEVDLESGPESVKILTVHSAKGLEWRYVFITNLVDRRFPSIERTEPIELPADLIKEIIPQGDIHLEEERRLFYVAITRARDGVFFTSADYYGGTQKKKLSRFLLELEAQGSLKLSPNYQEKNKDKEEKNVLNQDKFSLHFNNTLKKSSSFLANLPPKFSYTQLKAFEVCPLQYKFAHLLRIPVKGRATFSFGQTIHRTLAQFYHLIQERAAICQKNLFGESESKLVQVSLDELLKLYEECWIDDWYFSKQQKEEYKERGKEILKTFYQTNYSQFKPPLFIEQSFNLKIGEVVVKGVIDRVDEIEDGFEIIDYKTGSSKTEEDIDKDQLTIYQIALEEVFQKKPTRLTYYFIETNERVSFLAQEVEKNKIKEKILKTVEEIKKSDFPPKPSEHNCKHCDFNEICEFRAI
jgi:DNA helicase-2/ATP-dependent DNA helicase PcrA